MGFSKSIRRKIGIQNSFILSCLRNVLLPVAILVDICNMTEDHLILQLFLLSENRLLMRWLQSDALVPGDISSLDDWLKFPIEGIVLVGDKEEKPGLKNYDHLALILERLGGGEV
jgi:hypothetical protein